MAEHFEEKRSLSLRSLLLMDLGQWSAVCYYQLWQFVFMDTDCRKCLYLTISNGWLVAPRIKIITILEPGPGTVSSVLTFRQSREYVFLKSFYEKYLNDWKLKISQVKLTLRRRFRLLVPHHRHRWTGCGLGWRRWTRVGSSSYTQDSLEYSGCRDLLKSDNAFHFSVANQYVSLCIVC